MSDHADEALDDSCNNAAPSRRKLTVAEWLSFLVLVLFLGAIFSRKFLAHFDYRRLSPFYRVVQSDQRTGCANNLQMIGRVLSQYTKDYDGHWPPAAIGSPNVPGWATHVFPPDRKPRTAPVGWADVLQSVSSTTSALQCPSEPTPPTEKPASSGYTDFWFNSNLSARSVKSLAFPSSTLLVGEGSDGKDITDATYSKSSLPAAWLTDTNSPAYRHLGGANYLMADGAVHWLKPHEITTFGGRKNAFAIK